MQGVMGLWTVLMEVMKAAAVSSSQIFIFLNFELFCTIKTFISSCFGVGTSRAEATEFLLHSFCDSWVMISYQFTSDLVAELAKFLWEGGLTVMGVLESCTVYCSCAEEQGSKVNYRVNLVSWEGSNFVVCNHGLH